MPRFAWMGLVALVACANTVIVEGGAGGAASTSRSASGSGGASVSVVSVGSGSTSTTVASVSVATSSSSGGFDCLNEPDCPGCFCNLQPNGCFAYQQAIIDNIYCGMTCGVACADFCANQQDLPPACDDCVNLNLTQADIDAFIAACEASPGCLQFATDVQQCP